MPTVVPGDALPYDRGVEKPSRETLAAQHERIADGIRELRRAHDAEADWEALAERLDGLIAAVTAHFAEEERQMTETGYPLAAEHQGQHETFVRRLQLLRRECDVRETELVGPLTEILERWFDSHERGADRELTAHLRARASRSS